MQPCRLPKIEGSVLKYRVPHCPLPHLNKKLAWNVDCPPSKWKTKLWTPNITWNEKDPLPHKKKKGSPVYSMNVTLHGNSIPKISGHYFWPGLMAFLRTPWLFSLYSSWVFFLGISLSTSCCNLEEYVGVGKNRVSLVCRFALCTSKSPPLVSYFQCQLSSNWFCLLLVPSHVST
jgi:hypothetical protein